MGSAMSNFSVRADDVRPSAIHSYFDKIQVWRKSPISRDEYAFLTSQCGSVKVNNMLARFDWSYTQRLALYQPTKAVLEWLSGRNDVLVNICEVALDWIFDNQDDLERAYSFVDQHLVKKYHRLSHGVRYFEQTRYTGPPWLATKAVVYPDKPSRINGEPHCLHIDYRMSNRGAVRRAGIEGPADMVSLDHRRFWEDRLLMYALDPNKFGRAYHNHVEGKGRRHAPWVHRSHNGFAYDMDRRAGNMIVRSLGVTPEKVAGTTQEVIDQYRDRLPVRGSMQRLNVDHLLPESHGTL